MSVRLVGNIFVKWALTCGFVFESSFSLKIRRL
jgi:hypothetical protein